MTLPPIPKDRNWSPETWRAGLDEAVRRNTDTNFDCWKVYAINYGPINEGCSATIAHATTLLDAGIVKPVVSKAAALLREVYDDWDPAGVGIQLWDCPKALAVIQSALDKARSGE